MKVHACMLVLFVLVAILFGCSDIIERTGMIQISLILEDHDIPVDSSFTLHGFHEASDATFVEEMGQDTSITLPPLVSGAWRITAEAQVDGTVRGAGEVTVQVDPGKDLSREIRIRYTFTVTLDKQNGSGGTGSVSATYDEAMPEDSMSAPERIGYTFGGYYEERDGVGTQYYTHDMKSASDWDKAADRTLYAKWIADSHSLSFDANGGVGTMDSVELDTD
ncbi:MAG: InlB B-repeat-containing protein, partial [Sphaerochaetaceae bacterium]|nr:InlB B-repeat-containing protein [Sphaerochaetaceae bacterium]